MHIFLKIATISTLTLGAYSVSASAACLIEEPPAVKSMEEMNKLMDARTKKSRAAYDKYDLAYKYLKEDPKDIDKALELMTQASQEHAYITDRLSRHYLAGDFGEENKHKGIDVLKDRATKNLDSLTRPDLATLTLDLARLYLDEDDENAWLRDDKEGAQWMIKSAECGHFLSEYKVGVLYLEGRGLSQDTDKGMSILTDLAKRGSVPAKQKLEEILKNSQKHVEDVYDVSKLEERYDGEIVSTLDLYNLKAGLAFEFGEAEGGMIPLIMGNQGSGYKYPEFYTPTIREVLDIMAWQTRSYWKHIETKIVNDFILLGAHNDLPYIIDLKSNWRTKPVGFYSWHAPDIAGFGMDIYYLGHFTPPDEVEQDAFSKQVLEFASLSVLKMYNMMPNPSPLGDMKMVAFNDHHAEKALYWEPKEGLNGRAWRQWALFIDGHAFLIVNAAYPQNKGSVFKDVDEMLQTFRLNKDFSLRLSDQPDASTTIMRKEK